MIQNTNAMAPTATLSMSKRANGTGSRPGFSLTSQFRVKLGMIRPPISEISSTTTAMPARMPYSAAPLKCASRWNVTFPASRTRISSTTLRLFHFLPAMISRAAAVAISNRKPQSTSIAGSHPVSAENVTHALPAIHSATRNISGRPRSGSRPVQFGMAVNRNPVITAGRKPYSISWTCQSRGMNAETSLNCPMNTGSQTRMARPA